MRFRFWTKTESSVKAYVKYFHVQPDETPQQFEDRINNFFQTLENYTIEFDAFNEGSGLYFIRYIITETREYRFRWRYIIEQIKKGWNWLDT